ncbi:Haloalkane dehalogenase [Lacunisphaera limnophila]|uniref:Haloalkane dehalogenase n=1 Tax=Lacunisphaera limnophila TaxID=1838286 RepID=A0A1D8AY80_9BACT|nr:alpha/beta fold hydrolase [Lacunisphaera limnophila]AOS45838.1 Haloalkane dehalogenase [Lacunisphaera limnophila]
MVTGAQIPAWLKELYPFEPKRFDTGFGQLSYLDEGQGDEAVLMVHGNPTWSFFYRNVVLSLRGRIRCIVPDHLGCGLSDKPQDYDYTLPNHVANLGRLIDSLNLRKVHLIVHDWGGPIGLGTMLPRSEKLGKVVILNTAAFADTVVPARIRFCRIPLIGELAVRGFNGFAWPATWMAVTKPLPAAVKAGFLFPYDNWANRIATHRFVRDIPQGIGAPNDIALSKIEAALPVLAEKSVRIIWGGQDFCFNRHYFDRWQATLPNAKADYLTEAGHYLMEDARDNVIPQIERHILS